MDKKVFACPVCNRPIHAVGAFRRRLDEYGNVVLTYFICQDCTDLSATRSGQAALDEALRIESSLNDLLTASRATKTAGRPN